MSLRPHTSLKRRALYMAEAALYWSGFGYLYIRLTHLKSAVILMYHSVDSPATRDFIDPRGRITAEAFDAQMAFLARNRSVVTMTQLIRQLKAGDAPDPGTVVITFDDGYIDNFHVASPILSRYNLPATIYLSTEYVTSGQPNWVDHLYTAFSRRKANRLELPSGVYDLSLASQRLQAYRTISEALLTALPFERRELIDVVTSQLNPSEMPPRLMMNWQEVRQLQRIHPQIEFGSHGVNHLDLTCCSTEIVVSEILESVQRIQMEVNQTPRHFAFPYNRSNEQARNAVRKHGFCSAVADGEVSFVNTSTNVFALPRLDASNNQRLFRFWTSGAYPHLPLKLFGRA